MAYNLTRVLCGRALAMQHLNGPLRMPRSMMFTTTASQNVTLKVVAAPPQDKLSYEEKNAALKRELSPHLSIYKFQLTSVLSISHRATGMILSGLATALAVSTLISPHDFSYIVTVVEGLKLSIPTLAYIKFYIALPATFHTINGVRHLLWDSGRFLKLNEVYTTGYITLALSVLSALILTAL